MNHQRLALICVALRTAAVGGLGAVGFAASKLDAGFSEFFSDTIVKVRSTRCTCQPCVPWPTTAPVHSLNRRQ